MDRTISRASESTCSPWAKKITVFRPGILRCVRARASKPESAGWECWSCTICWDSSSVANIMRASMRRCALTLVPAGSTPVCATAISSFSGPAASVPKLVLSESVATAMALPSASRSAVKFSKRRRRPSTLSTANETPLSEGTIFRILVAISCAFLAAEGWKRSKTSVTK